ncbi:MAG: hypothetical protein QOI41_992, partial [Myxococcales bacterium]|nr:hypothetical protein [Myxococcales bacterium]
MRPRFALFVALTSGAAFAQLAACGSTAPDPGGFTVSPAKDAGKSKTDAADPVIDEPDTSVTPPDPPGGPGRVYAHTNDTLYLYEPTGGTLKRIGAFTFDMPATKADIIDIAVDRTGNMYGTTFNDFFSIDTSTAKCTWISIAATAVDYPNALSFVPAGTADPSKEALVGYATSIGDSVAVTYVQIDTTTGAMTTRGNLNAS